MVLLYCRYVTSLNFLIKKEQEEARVVIFPFGQGLVKKYSGGWAGAERGWVMRF